MNPILTLKETPQQVFDTLDGGKLYLYTEISSDMYRGYLATLTDNRELSLLHEAVYGELVGYHGFLWENTYYYVGFQRKKHQVTVVETTAPYPEKVEGKGSMHETLAVLDLDYSKVARQDDCSGMCYVFRLCDGTFFLYDGGYSWDDEVLYRYLSTHCEGKPVISGWLITHGHGDHVGFFPNFSKKFADKVEIRNVYYNDVPNTYATATTKGWDPYLKNRFLDDIKAFPGAKLWIVHSGTTLQLPNFEVEIMQTWEDAVPYCMRWQNEASVVSRVHTAGQTFLFPGECEQGADPVLERFGPFLKSDFYQIPHHSYSGSTPQICEWVDADYLILPSSYECLAIRMQNDWHNHTLRYLLCARTMKGLFVSDNPDKILTLPYNKPDAVEYIRH